MRRVSKAKKNLLQALRTYPVLVHKNFCLFHAGEKGGDYFDIDRLTCHPSIQKDLVKEFVGKIRSMEKRGMQYNKIAFIDKEMGPFGVIILASTFSKELDKNIVILRLRKTLRFDHVKVKGWIEHRNEYPLTQGDSVLLIDDVITTGGTQKEAIELVEGFNAKVTGIVCAFARSDEVVENIKEEKGVDFIETIWSYAELVAQGYVLSNPRYLLSQNLAYILANEVFPRKEARKVGKALDEELEAIVSKMLEEHRITADHTVKQGLKNLYLNMVMSSIQSSKRENSLQNSLL